MITTHSRTIVYTMLASVALVVPFHSSPALAEIANADDNPAGDKGESQLAEIVVTAQKRSESINRVGMSITAFSQQELQTQGIKDVADLQKLVPGFTFTHSFTSVPVYSIRGVGFYETTLSAYPAVSVYLDQVPLPFPALTTNVGLDTERIEILKGPQGTLFGQNSTGGAINYVAVKPTRDFHAGVTAGYGRFNDAELDGYISGPLSDTVSARLSFKEEHADAWQHSYYRPVNGINGTVDRAAARVLLDWTPSDRLTLELNLNASIDGSQPQAPQYVGNSVQNAGKNGNAILAYPFAPPDPRAADFSNNNIPHGDEHQWQASLRGDYSPVNDLTITSITSYVSYKRNDRSEYGGTVLESLELTHEIGSIHSFFQELRLANDAQSNMRWLVGLNYDHSTVYDFDDFNFSGSTTDDTLGISSNPFYTDQTMTTYAGFANVGYDLTSQLTLKAGARYTRANRHTDSCTLGNEGGGVDALFDSITSALHGGAQFPPLRPLDCVSFDPVSLFPTRQPYSADLDQQNVSWSAGLDFRVSTDALLYFNVARGYKAGSFPTASASTTFQFLPVTQESLLDYEGGFKATLFDHHLQLNGGAYYYDYTNKQIRSQVNQPIFGVINNLVNVPKSKVTGAELEMAWQPIDGLRLGVSGAYTDAVVVRYVGTNGAGVIADFAGSPLPYTPKWTFSGTADYSWNLPGNYVASVGATASYQGHADAIIGATPIEKLESYTLLDLHTALETRDGRWRVTAYGRNVTNKYYWTNVVQAFDTVVRYTGMPATYGATLSYRY